MDYIPYPKNNEYTKEKLNKLNHDELFEDILDDRAYLLLNKQLFTLDELPADYSGALVSLTMFNWFSGSFSANNPYYYDVRNIVFAREFLDRIAPGPISVRLNKLEKEFFQYSTNTLNAFYARSPLDGAIEKHLWQLTEDTELSLLIKKDLSESVNTQNKIRNYLIANWPFQLLSDDEYYLETSYLISKLSNYPERIERCGALITEKPLLKKLNERFIETSHVNIHGIPPPLSVIKIRTTSGFRYAIKYKDAIEYRYDINGESILIESQNAFPNCFRKTHQELKGWRYNKKLGSIELPKHKFLINFIKNKFKILAR